MHNQKGFTLIELLVVISIIALLSSVVLSSLNTARTKSADTALKVAMKQMHTQAQNYLDSNPNLTFGISTRNCVTASTLFVNTQFTAILTNALSNAGSSAVATCTTDTSGSRWAVSITPLRGGGSWCTDNSQGWFRTGSSVAGICS